MSEVLHLPRVGFVAAFAAAQALLLASDPDTEHVWVLPPGVVTLAAGLVAGAPDRALTLRGRSTSELVFRDGGPIAGDVVGVSLSGSRVRAERFAVRVRATGDAVGVHLQGATTAGARSVRLTLARGTSVLGLRLRAPGVEVTECAVENLVASATVAVGVHAKGSRVLLSDVRARAVRGPNRAVGIGALGSRLSVSQLHAQAVRASTAAGMRLVASGEDAVLGAADLRVDGVVSPPGGAIALGIVARSGEDLQLRGFSVHKVRGDEAAGVELIAAGEIDVLAGEVRMVVSRARGAAGFRALAGPSRQDVAVRDLRVEDVRGLPVKTVVRPAASWNRWAGEASVALTAGDPVPGRPALPMPDHAEEVVGLHIGAVVTEFEPWIESDDPGAIYLEQTVVRRISGAGLQVEGELRDVQVRGVEQWYAVRAGWIDGERILLANLAFHRALVGLTLGPGQFSLVNSVWTGVVNGDVLRLAPGAELSVALAAFVDVGEWPLLRLADDPWVTSGPSGVPPSVRAGGPTQNAPVDLRVAASAELVPEPVPGELGNQALFVGAWPPEVDTRCELRDPLAPAAEPLPAPLEDSPPVDYRARDARSLLAVMVERAATALPTWTDGNPADQTTMVLELLASRLDHLSYRQERAVAEGFLDTARTRRSVQDHARLLDYDADPGLSATALLRFTVDDDGLAALGLGEDDVLEIPAGTLVGNRGTGEESTVFETEEALAFRPELRELSLAEDVLVGATHAVLDRDLETLVEGDWLAILGDRDTPHLVVRVTELELGTDTTTVRWDPRRPSPAHYRWESGEEEPAIVLGNLAVAHHGVPLAPAPEDSDEDPMALLAPWRELMHIETKADGRSAAEVDLPLHPISRHAPGWPLPGERRSGRAQLSVVVDGEPWEAVDNLALVGPSDEVYVLREARSGGATLRFGDGVNGAPLPPQAEIDVGAHIGLGLRGNAGVGTLVRLLALPAASTGELLLSGDADREEELRRIIKVDNPIPATGGREGEPLSRIRYRAPRDVRQPLSAVTPADYVRLIEDMPEVSAARAVVHTLDFRAIIRLTVLLVGEDTLDDDERLRRWALVRQKVESVRLLGFDVEIIPPTWIPLDIDLVADALPWAKADHIRGQIAEVLGADGGLFDPDTGGLGGDVHLDSIVQAVLDVPGVSAARVLRLRRFEPWAIERIDEGVLPIGSDEVAVLVPPYGAGPEGLLTVTVCGGQP